MAIAPDVLEALRARRAPLAEGPSSRPRPAMPTLPPGVSLDAVARLDPRQCEAVQTLARACGRHDGVEPLCEQTLLRLAHGGEDAFAVLARDEQRALVGYAQAACLDDGPSGDVAVALPWRGRGLGRRLLWEIQRHARESGLEAIHTWARGDLPAARWLAIQQDAIPERVLLELVHPLEPLDPAALPDDVRLRAFDPGRDAAPWLELHNQAFAWHPEQSAWTEADLRARLGQPWFSAAGFLLAEDAEGLCGFVWTKLSPGLDGVPEGEIYIVGVAPRAQGRGLGRALTLAGLEHMRRHGAKRGRLFVESDNMPARRLYDRLGFRVRQLHVRYRIPV
jgi:mycothiol synthase